jgi:GPH family glycoside/pentoside/hexuronide:cation symporter
MNKTAHTQTPPGARVPVGQKTSYGVGMIAYAMMVNGYSQMVNPIFNVNLGLSPIMIGWVTAIARVWDAITDPFMGTVTDNTRSRFGRRRPWILAGAIIGALTFVGIWWFPLGQSSMFYFGWLLVATLIFYVGFTIFSVPYIALGMEMSPDYHERTRVVSYCSFLGPIGAFAAQGLFWFCTLSVFETPVVGMRWTCLGVGVVIITCGAFAAIFPSESSGSKEVVSKQKKVSLIANSATGLLLITGKVEKPQRVVIYGPEGIGKSTLAAAFPEPVYRLLWCLLTMPG